MGLCSLVFRRDGMYTFRKRVPDDLQGIIGKKTIKKSLGTQNPDVAKQRRALMEAEVMELFKAKRAELNGEAYTPPAVQLSNGVAMQMISHQSNATARGMGKTLREIFELWAAEKRHGAWNPAKVEETIKRYERMANKFIESQGNPLIGDFDLSQNIAFKDHLISTANGELKNKTINTYLTAIEAIVGFACAQHYIKVNPLSGKKYHLDETDSVTYLSYEKSDLERLFITPEYRALRKEYPARFWMPLLGLYTGARIEELAQLKVQDVAQSSGIYYISIGQRERDQGVKNKKSIRQVPLHPELLKIGFIQYVNSLPQQDRDFIFPELKAYASRRALKVTTWYSEYKTKVGIDDDKKVFHSFRHTLVTACKKAKLLPDMRYRITGHVEGNSGSGYGDQYEVEDIYPDLCRVKYAVDFSSLYVPGHEHIKSPAEATATTHEKIVAEPAFKELLQSVSLAEAYNRIGRKIHGKNWTDYEICIASTKYSLLSQRKTGHNGQPIMRPLKVSEFIQCPKERACAQDKDKHHLPLVYFSKALVTRDGVRCFYKIEGSPTFYVLDEKMRAKLVEHREGLPMSYMLTKENAEAKEKRVDMLVDVASLEKFLNEHVAREYA